MSTRIALGILCLLAAFGCLEMVATLLRAAPDPDRFLRIGLLAQGVWLFLALGGALLATRAPVGERLGLRRGRLRAVHVAGLALAFVVFSNGLYQTIGALALRGAGSLAEIDRNVAATRGQPSFWLATLVLGLLPGLSEELFFRGLVQRALLRHAGAMVSVLASAALFAAAHADPVHSSAALAMGLYLGAVAWRAESVRPAIVCHALNNLLGVVGIGTGGVARDLALVPALLVTVLGAAAGAGVLWRAERGAGR